MVLTLETMESAHIQHYISHRIRRTLKYFRIRCCLDIHHSIFTTVDAVEQQNAQSLSWELQNKETSTVCRGYSLGFKAFSSLLQVCKSMNELQQIHARILMSGLEQNIVLVPNL